MKSHLARVLECLDGVKPSGSSQWSARCPLHDDQQASLSISLGGEKHPDAVMLRCWAGCPTPDVVAAMGLTMADLYPDTTHRGVRMHRRHQYTDVDGNVLYAVDRLGRSSGQSWRYVHPSSDGPWVSGRGDGPRVLYNLPDIVRCPDSAVWVTEGERDADTLSQRGELATTVASGSWKGVDLSVLTGRRVRIAVDNDRAGWERGRAALVALHGAGALIEGVYRPADGCKDVTNHFESAKGELLPVELDLEPPPCETWDSPTRRRVRPVFASSGLALGVRTPVPLFLHYFQTGQLSQDGVIVWLILEDRAGPSRVARVTRAEIDRLVGWGHDRASISLKSLCELRLVRELRRGVWQVLNPCRERDHGLDIALTYVRERAATSPFIPPRPPNTSPANPDQTGEPVRRLGDSASCRSHETGGEDSEHFDDPVTGLLDAFPGSSLEEL
jgi:hypothetical protein